MTDPETLLLQLHDELYRAQRTENVEVLTARVSKARLLLTQYRGALTALAGNGWPQYIAGVIETYIKQDRTDEDRETAIAKIIERRLCSLAPASRTEQAAPSVASRVADDATLLAWGERHRIGADVKRLRWAYEDAISLAAPGAAIAAREQPSDAQIMACFAAAKAEGQGAYMLAVGRAILALASRQEAPAASAQDECATCVGTGTVSDKGFGLLETFKDCPDCTSLAARSPATVAQPVEWVNSIMEMVENVADAEHASKTFQRLHREFLRAALEKATQPYLSQPDKEAPVEDDRLAKCDAFLTAGQAFWASERAVGMLGAVKWAEGDDGSLAIFTRGEYRELLLKNIEEGLPVHSFVEPSARKQRLLDLADRIDPEELWRVAGIDHSKFTADQKNRLDAGVALRRYADLWAPGRWVVFPPVGPVHFSASSLDKAYEMAKRHEVLNRAGDHTN